MTPEIFNLVLELAIHASVVVGAAVGIGVLILANDTDGYINYQGQPVFKEGYSARLFLGLIAWVLATVFFIAASTLVLMVIMAVSYLLTAPASVVLSVVALVAILLGAYVAHHRWDKHNEPKNEGVNMLSGVRKKSILKGEKEDA